MLGRFFTNFMEYAGRQEFWEALLLNMQTDRTTTSTACLTMLSSFNKMLTEVQNYNYNDSFYKAQQKAKGKSNGGTTVGFWIDTVVKYSDVAVKTFDIYNTCKIDYYLTSLGKQVTTVTGATGFVSNLAGLLLSSLTADSSSTSSSNSSIVTNSTTTAASAISFSTLNNALATHNADAVGKFLGQFIFKLITVEIPVYKEETKNPYPYQVSGALTSRINNSNN